MLVSGRCEVVGVKVAMAILQLLVLAEGGATCGCWGSDRVYLQYKAPATGWYTTLTDKYIYERKLTLSREEIHYLLEYKSRSKSWALFQRRLRDGINYDGETLVISSWEEQIIVLCPTRCSCRKISVDGTPCWATNGNFIRRDILDKQDIADGLRMFQKALEQGRDSSNVLGCPYDLHVHSSIENEEQGHNDFIVRGSQDNQEPVHIDFSVQDSVNTHELTEQITLENETKSFSILWQSNCLLDELAKCIESKEHLSGQVPDSQEESTREDEDCQQYTWVLANDTLQESSKLSDNSQPPEEYILKGRDNKSYVLTQAKDGDFWWIVEQNNVYVISDDAGPCPDQLPPGTKWISGEDLSEDLNITIVCTEWDTPEGN